VPDPVNTPAAATSAAPPAEPIATNLPVALAAGLAAALVGAVLWAVVTVVTHYRLGLAAVGVGFLVGWAVQRTGRSGAPVLGIAGAVLAFVGCLLGNLLADASVIAQQGGTPIAGTVLAVLARPSLAIRIVTEGFSAMQVLFYGIAVYEGFKIARRPAPP